MHRRSFFRLLAAAPLAPALQLRSDLPALRVVSRYSPAATPGMPGPHPGRVVSITSDRCVDTSTGRANDEAVRLYRKLIFQVTSTMQGYYKDGESAYLMAQQL